MNFVYTHHQDFAPLPLQPTDTGDLERTIADAASHPPVDAIIHGVRVRLYTNNDHWRRFWSANWFAEGGASLVGQPPPTEPQVQIFAAKTDPDTPPRAAFDHENATALLVGDVPYGQLRTLALRVLGQILAEEQAVHLIRAACIQQDANATLLLLPPAADAAEALPALFNKHAHLLACESVAVRYGLVRMVDGVTLLPTFVIDEKGHQINGYPLFPWLEEYGYWEPRADARCLTLDGREEYCFARDLDLGRAPEAFAYPLERAWYVSTGMVAAHPELATTLVHAELENVPPAAPDWIRRFGDWARLAAPPALITELGEDAAVEVLCRLRAAPVGRAMLTPEQVWPRCAGGPPLQITQVAHLTDDALTPISADDLLDALDQVTFRSGGDEMVTAFVNLLARALEA